MSYYLAGWKNLQEVQIPSVKNKGFSEEIILRNKVEPKKKLFDQDAPTVNFNEEQTENTDKQNDPTVYMWQEAGPIDDDATVLLNIAENYVDDDATVLLDACQTKTILKVIRMKTAEEQQVYSDSFVIGKSKTCDFIVNENPTISRRHAEIKKENGEYYLYDLESANHTYVNDVELKEPVKITGNMLFKMSDEDFIITVENK